MLRLRRCFGTVLAAVMVLAVSVPAFADDYSNEEYVIPSDGEGAYEPSISKARDISDDPLIEADMPDTRIVGIDIPTNPQNHDFVIRSASSIRLVEKQLLADNRIVLDFSTAINGLNDQYAVNDPVVTRIRTGQLTPKITRVVFDLKAGADFMVSMSDDRRSVTVRFVVNTITNLYFHGEGDTDVIELTGEYCPILNIAPVAGTNFIMVDMPLTTLRQPAKYFTDMNFVKTVNAQQLNENTARLVLESYGMASFSVDYSGNMAVLKLSPATYKNIYYTADKTLKLQKDPGYRININDIQREDEYANSQFIFKLPGKYTDWIGWGDYIINDEILHDINIRTDGSGRTEIVFQQKSVMAYDFWEDSQYIYIKPVSPKQKYDKIVIVDPGHGGNAPGAIANGLVEKDINLDVCNRLISLIERDGRVKAYATRVTDRNVDLYDRPAWASEIGDIFVSVHMNAMSGGNTWSNGTEVYYYPHNNDGRLGFSGRQMAQIFERNLTNGLNTQNMGVKSSRFVVIANTSIPAVLCEVGFLTNYGDASRLATQGFRQDVAQSLFDSVMNVFEVYRPQR